MASRDSRILHDLRRRLKRTSDKARYVSDSVAHVNESKCREAVVNG